MNEGTQRSFHAVLTLLLASSSVAGGNGAAYKFASGEAYVWVFSYVTIVSALCLFGFVMSPNNKPSTVLRGTVNV